MVTATTWKTVNPLQRIRFTAHCGKCGRLLPVTAVRGAKEWKPIKTESLREELEARNRFDPYGARPHECGVMLACGHQNNIMTSHRQLFIVGVVTAE